MGGEEGLERVGRGKKKEGGEGREERGGEGRKDGRERDRDREGKGW